MHEALKKSRQNHCDSLELIIEFSNSEHAKETEELNKKLKDD